jgi:hypothetical protein
VIATISVLQAATFDTLSGMVKNETGAVVSGAFVSLVRQPLVKDTTDDKGVFNLLVQKSIALISYKMVQENDPKIGIQGKRLQLQTNSDCQNVRIALFSSNGRMLSSVKMEKPNAGVQSHILPELATGFYMIQISINKKIITFPLIFNGSDYYLNGVPASASSIRYVTNVAAIVVVDTIVVSKDGYDDTRSTVESYNKKDISIILQKSGSVACPTLTLPANADLKANPKLPDPFTFLDGSKWTKKSQWSCRRAEMFAIAQQYLYGHMPPKPDSVWGSVSGGKITVNCKYKTKSVNFSIDAGNGTGDILILSYGSGLPVAPAGSRTASVSMDNFKKNITSLYESSDAGLCMAGAWGVSRIIDVLEQNPDKGFDPKKVMVTGCSFAGKAALTSGAFCEKVALTVAVESGACGAACWRTMKYYRSVDPDPCKNWQGNSESGDSNCKPQTIDKLESDWLGTVAKPWRDKKIDVDNLPLDQHFVIALCIPRPCLIVTNSEAWHWLCPKAETVSAACANSVYDAMGLADHFGYISGNGYMHCSTSGVAHHVDACKEFYAKFFEGKTANTTTYKGNSDIFKCNSGFCLDTAKWVDWNMNVTLQ